MYPIMHNDIAKVTPRTQGFYTFQQQRPSGIGGRAELIAYIQSAQECHIVAVWLYYACRAYVLPEINMLQHTVMTICHTQHADHNAWQPRPLWQHRTVDWTLCRVFAPVIHRMLSNSDDPPIALYFDILTTTIEHGLPMLRGSVPEPAGTIVAGR